MANVAINVEVRSNGEVVLGKLGQAMKATDEKAKGLTSRMGEFSGAIGQTSKALARSADVFGLNAVALRALDDTMDVAEMGFSNLSKSAAGFNATSVAVAAAAGAVGYAIGSWLRTFPAVQKTADSLIGSLYRLTQAQADLDKQAAAGRGIKQFSERMAAADLEAKKKQIAWLKSQGKTEEDIAALYQGKGSLAARVVGQDAQLRALGLDEPSMAKKKKAKEDEKKNLSDIKQLLDDAARSAKHLGEVYLKNAIDAAEYKGTLAKNIGGVFELPPTRYIQGTMLGGNFADLTEENRLALLADPIQAAADAAYAAEKAEEKATKQAERWQAALQGVALLAGAIGGRMGEAITAAGNISESFKGWSKMTGAQKFNTIAGGIGQIGGVIGGGAGAAIQGAAGGAMTGAAIGSIIPGIGTVIGGVIGGVAGLIGGIFGHKKQKEKERKEALSQFEEIKKQLIEQYGSWDKVNLVAEKYGVTLTKVTDKKSLEKFTKEMEALEKRMNGLKMAVTGISTVIENLTYTDAKGQIVNTFSDPKVAEAAAGLFSTTFWQVFQKEGVAGIEALRPAWEKLHADLKKMGLDPAKMGLGSIGHMFDVTKDPRTKALLGVSQGAGELLRGAMDAGYVDQGFLRDSTTIARSTLSELQNQGLSAEDAARASVDQLVALNQAYQATGQEMPEDLKAAMEAAGITVLPTQLEVMKESRDYLKQIAGAAGHAEGAIVTRPHLAWVGEKGPEAIIPLSGRRGQMGSSVNVTINRSLGVTRETEYAFDRRVERTVRRLFRQNGAVKHDAQVAVNGGR